MVIKIYGNNLNDNENKGPNKIPDQKKKTHNLE